MPGSILIYRSELPAGTGNTATSSSKTMFAWNSRERSSFMWCPEIQSNRRFQIPVRTTGPPLDLCRARGPVGWPCGCPSGKAEPQIPFEALGLVQRESRVPERCAGQTTGRCSLTLDCRVFLPRRAYGVSAEESSANCSQLRPWALRPLLAAETRPCHGEQTSLRLNPFPVRANTQLMSSKWKAWRAFGKIEQMLRENGRHK